MQEHIILNQLLTCHQWIYVQFAWYVPFLSSVCGDGVGESGASKAAISRDKSGTRISPPLPPSDPVQLQKVITCLDVVREERDLARVVQSVTERFFVITFRASR